MHAHKARTLGFFFVALLVFGGLMAAIGILGQLNLMPKFTGTQGTLFTAMIWIGAAIIVPVSFLKGLSWMARGRRHSDSSEMDISKFAEDGPQIQEFKVDPVDRYGRTGQQTAR